ncbi:MAG: bifunctional demethylmenaquinone methyltransferase/2-methoxy-6-polyprenyl-1,4-benzoquinol methylase UbiE [Acidobacteriota bacterium]|nr:bifunctional demethylmenaquinone methyltransferase/2-methoxy-6-polyprenyl-1,4-benzoquinol methylase UbiE [Acidobacteriota bacterium]
MMECTAPETGGRRGGSSSGPSPSAGNGSSGGSPSGARGPVDGSGAMFDAIAERYDRLNRVLSLGVDRRWRKRTVGALELPADARVLDLATGTADLALLIARSHPDARVLGSDPSEGMLEVGREKVRRAGAEERVELETGDARSLPYEDDSFDGVTIAFGIRNVPDRPAALREMARVTRPGGRVAILELSEPQGGLLAPFARFHIQKLVPWVGSLLSSAPEYRYLERSIAAFPAPRDFARMMGDCGLEVVSVQPLTFGVCHLFVARPRQQAPTPAASAEEAS